MGLSNRNGLSIAELVVYAPAAVMGLTLFIRHGFRILTGWLFLLLFCLIRITGAALNLATINNPKVIAFYTVPVELFTVGQVVVIYVTLGLLARLTNSINKIYPTRLKAIYFQLLRIPLIVGIILVILGLDGAEGTWLTTGIYATPLLAKIGTIIVVAAFAVLVLMAGVFIPRRSQAEPTDRFLLDMVMASFPLILIRIIYSLLSAFVEGPTFNPIYGNVAALGLLAIVEEMIVTIIYVTVGFRLPQLPKKVEANAESDRSRRWSRSVGGIQRLRNFTGRVPGHKVGGPEAAGRDPVQDERAPIKSLC